MFLDGYARKANSKLACPPLPEVPAARGLAREPYPSTSPFYLATASTGMTVTTRTLDDGTVEICVIEGGMTELGWVSSMHLTETKINQLKAVIARKSAAAFFDRSQNISDG